MIATTYKGGMEQLMIFFFRLGTKGLGHLETSKFYFPLRFFQLWRISTIKKDFNELPFPFEGINSFF